MTVSVQQAVEEARAEQALQAAAPMAQATTIIQHAATTPKPVVAPAVKQQAQQTAAAQATGSATLPGVNPQDFINANRIHVKDGSLFVDPYLVLHPRELAPENEAQLRKKLQLTYSINNPSFFESRSRMAIALNLGQLLPVSPEAKRSRLIEEVNKFNTQVETGKDADLQKDFDRKMTPFASIVQQVTQHPAADPVGMDLLKNGLAMYLLVREKMTQAGYLDKLTDYVVRSANPEQVMADLSSRIGITPLAMREAALKGGLEGVGKLLGLDPRYVAEAKTLSEYAATQDFSYNVVEHWHLGRQLQGLNAPMSEKMTVGMDARITAKISEYRDRVRHHYDVPEPVKKQQAEIAEALNLAPPVQRALMFKQGYEICYTPEVTADSIAFYRGVYGLHRKAANDMRDTQGTYRIYFSGHGDMKGSVRTLIHEMTHDLCPEHFAPAEIPKIDALVKSDERRFANFQHLMDNHYTEFETLFNAYKTAGDDSQRQAMSATANKRFAAYGFDAQGLFPYLRDAHDFKYAVKHAYDTLSIEGERYNRSGYASPEERFREVLSRFAELSQVEYRGEPQFLQFLAPGLNQVYEAHYLPHLARVLQGIENGTIPRTQKPTIVADALNGSVDETTKLKEQPKVEQRPVAPVGTTAPADAIACGNDAAPLPQIDAHSIQLNQRVLPAMQALNTLGIGHN